MVGNIDSDKDSYISLNDLNTHLLVVGTQDQPKRIASNIVEHGIKNNIRYIDGKGDEAYGSRFISFSKQPNLDIYLAYQIKKAAHIIHCFPEVLLVRKIILLNFETGRKNI